MIATVTAIAPVHPAMSQPTSEINSRFGPGAA
jgi:hypothetical protein